MYFVTFNYYRMHLFNGLTLSKGSIKRHSYKNHGKNATKSICQLIPEFIVIREKVITS